MKSQNMKLSIFSILTFLLVWLSQQGVDATRVSKKMQNRPASRQLKERFYPTYGESMPNSLQYRNRKTSTIFNVKNFGAKGDGTTDDTKAFQATWLAACKLDASTMVVPKGSIFLIKPISFAGPNCGSNIIFQLDGKIIAPKKSGSWESGLLWWIEFTKLNGITIRGSGVVDGQGSGWWSESGSKPTAIRFYGSSDVTVTGITIQNSQQTHLKFDNCQSVQVFGITVSSPGDSPNTDGIHLQNSQDVTIHSSKLACGDDCVSIQTGCSGINIENVDCGPGHGISIGSLGKDKTVACVSNITVSNTKIHDTLTGVRIKTWQGGSGSVQGVTFSNIQVSKVKTPIIIDQYYCDGGNCKNDTSAVAVSGVSYQNIRGTYTQNPVRFACSDSLPCTDVTLDTIQLQQVQAGYDDSGLLTNDTESGLKEPKPKTSTRICSNVKPKEPLFKLSNMKSQKMNISIFSILTFVLVWLSQQCVDAATDVKHKKHHSGARVMKETFYPKFGESRPTSFQYRKTSTIFNVRHFGAKGDGTTDDTKAFQAAWLAACKLEASTMVVPKGSVFLVKPISFSGSNCKSNIVFQVNFTYSRSHYTKTLSLFGIKSLQLNLLVLQLDGKIIAPKKSASWPSGLRQWLEFTKLNGITIRGTGVIDGQGSGWWTTESGIKPTAVRFYGSSDVTVTGITIQNSQQTHLKFDNCESVQVFGITVSSPGDSPNTDGIHLQNSQDVSIQSSKLACGDDCVSIQTGCSGVNIQNVDCGPGHGISIGSLGKDHTVACVSNITVRDTKIHGTMTGVRIKTWQGGLGSVKGVTFANIQISEVQTPIIIDQFYCGGSKCHSNKTSAVAVSGISYKNIRGTYTKSPVRFACSDSVPCTGVSLDTIQLQPAPYIGVGAPFCSNIYGQVKTSTTPRISCLMVAKPSKRYAQSNYDSCQY
ncbi:pectin lyase-like superfamily protein [Artemisia annua]|uniref:Pectin lyase-like superfamily protein n=1 Tax=Artemisia annua TaxID=35608 RepID=A0A2U1LGD8_ARTAN|nr:pectin lyase-like superfamily protein [Artemisia annua]